MGAQCASTTRAREAQPDGVEIRVVEARLHRRHGDSNRALELLLSLSESEQANEGVASELAMNWTLIDRPERAAEAWAQCFRARSHTPAAGRIAINVAEAWIAAGSMEKASVWLEQAELFGVPADRIEGIRESIPAADDQD